LDFDDDELLLELLSLSSAPEVAIHGTKLDAWSKIRISGLSKMGRNYVHLATGLPNEQNVVSGMRSNSTVLIYVDVPQAMEDGVQFWHAANGVVLTRGVGDTGILPRKYFTRVRVRLGYRLVERTVGLGADQMYCLAMGPEHWYTFPMKSRSCNHRAGVATRHACETSKIKEGLVC
jgi:RNA 2'-phosphotransferase, Tpt1 / KptA family